MGDVTNLVRNDLPVVSIHDGKLYGYVAEHLIMIYYLKNCLSKVTVTILDA
jgi:hypothetical protein